jgi:ribosomal protein S18 acetylase RimI-like enzyme
VEYFPHPPELLPPNSEEEWSQAELLIAELQEWDAQQSLALGFDRDEVLSTFYPNCIADIRRDSVPPDGRFLLAIDAGLWLGCAAFRRLTDSECELYDVYVRPNARGRGVASLLLRRLLSDAKAAGYETMLRETAVFMREAHGLYRSLHFQTCSPYRTVPPRFANATIWMECRFPA